MRTPKPVFIFCLVAVLLHAHAQTPAWLWASYAANGKGEALSCATDPFGNVFVTGYTQVGQQIFDNDTIPAPYLNGIFLTKYDSLGQAVWAQYADSSYSEIGYDVAADQSGNSILVGSFGAAIVFGNDTLIRNGAGTDSYIVKYDPAG